MINSRELSELVEGARTRAEDLIDSAKSVGIELLVTSTYRDFPAQAACFARGRTAPGEACSCKGHINPIGSCRLHPMGLKATMAKPGHSWHNWRCALDVVPMVGGKPVWSDTLLWNRIGALGTDLGLEWAGTWDSFPEQAHFQWTNGQTLQTLLERFPKGL